MAEFSKLVAHHRLLNRPEVVLTPHVAFNSHEAMERLTGITVENINAYLEGPPVGHTLRMNYWLVKQEPTAYSWDDFVKDGKTAWTGVRNFQARNNLRSMRAGDRVLFYHSVTDKAIIGEAEVIREAFTDPDG